MPEVSELPMLRWTSGISVLPEIAAAALSFVDGVVVVVVGASVVVVVVVVEVGVEEEVEVEVEVEVEGAVVVVVVAAAASEGAVMAMGSASAPTRASRVAMRCGWVVGLTSLRSWGSIRRTLLRTRLLRVSPSAKDQH